MTGLRKQAQINHLCKLLDKKKIKFNREDIESLSTSQLRKRVDELGGITENKRNSYESRGKIANRESWI